jgi:hypothetical protein
MYAETIRYMETLSSAEGDTLIQPLAQRRADALLARGHACEENKTKQEK